MISSQRGSDEPSQVQIQELIKLFDIYIDGPEGCRERAYRLLERYPGSRTVREIAAACDSIVGKYSQAIAGYQRCLQIEPKTLAYSNNQAWNLIQLKENQIAMTLLSDIKDKWNHPAIYSNWATILQNLGGNNMVLEETLKKRDQLSKSYPQYSKRTANIDLIHTFLLNPDQNYTGTIEQFRIQTFQLVQVLLSIQKSPLSIDTLKQRLYFMQDKIRIRKQQEQKSGIIIDPLLKIAMTGLQILYEKILTNYEQNYADELQKYVLKSIEIINNNLFCQKIESGFDYKLFEENRLIPTIYQLLQIGQYMQKKLKQRSGQFFKIQKQHNDEKQYIVSSNELNQKKVAKEHYQMQKMQQLNLRPIDDNLKYISVGEQQNIEGCKQQQQHQMNYDEKPNPIADVIVHEVQKQSIPNQILQHFPLNPQPNPIMNQHQNLQIGYNFYIRLQQVEQIEKSHDQYLVQKLRIDKQNQSNPLFIILHFRIKAIDSYVIFINIRRVNQQVRMLPYFVDLQLLSTDLERNRLKRYYLILNNILRFYDYYGTHNFIYEVRGIKSHLQVYNYMKLIAPVLDHVFADEDIFSDWQVGDICVKIHSMIVNYISETKKKGDFLRSFKTLLKRLHTVVISVSENPVQNLLQSLLQLKQTTRYIDMLLDDSLLTIDSSTRYHEYFIKRMNSDLKGQDDGNWLMFNISILLLSYVENIQNDESLEFKFRYCYYSSRVTLSGREVILRRFYMANNNIPLMERVGAGVKSVLSHILP